MDQKNGYCPQEKSNTCKFFIIFKTIEKRLSIGNFSTFFYQNDSEWLGMDFKHDCKQALQNSCELLRRRKDCMQAHAILCTSAIE